MDDLDLDLDGLDASELDLEALDIDDTVPADANAEAGAAAGDPPPLFDGPDEPRFGTAAGISDDSYQETVSWSNSFNGYYGDVTGRPMEPS